MTIPHCLGGLLGTSDRAARYFGDVIALSRPDGRYFRVFLTASKWAQGTNFLRHWTSFSAFWRIFPLSSALPCPRVASRLMHCLHYRPAITTPPPPGLYISYRYLEENGRSFVGCVSLCNFTIAFGISRVMFGGLYTIEPMLE